MSYDPSQHPGALPFLTRREMLRQTSTGFSRPGNVNVEVTSGRAFCKSAGVRRRDIGTSGPREQGWTQGHRYYPIARSESR